jgi:putative addiction module component (TIGR02574 family)
MMTKEQIVNEAMSLSPQDRDDLAVMLWQSISEGDLPAETIQEIRHRLQAVAAGEGSFKTSDEVVARLRKKLSI